MIWWRATVMWYSWQLNMIRTDYQNQYLKRRLYPLGHPRYTRMTSGQCHRCWTFQNVIIIVVVDLLRCVNHQHHHHRLATLNEFIWNRIHKMMPFQWVHNLHPIRTFVVRKHSNCAKIKHSIWIATSGQTVCEIKKNDARACPSY